jgi:tetratricopeptide (TPR) repeat protein
MAEPDDPDVLRLVVVFLRFKANMTQMEFGKTSRVDQSDISKYELGKQPLPEQALRRMAAAACVEWPVVVHLRRFYAAVLSPAARAGEFPGAEPLALSVLEPALLAVTPYLIEDRRVEPQRRSPEEARREAEVTWSALERFPLPRRRRLLELSVRAGRSWAMAEKVSHASVLAAAHSAREALELADLALSLAERVPGPESLRCQGYGWAHVGNARRVATDFAGADAAFARAWELWRAGAAADPELLPEWRLLDLEASLRREQRRFPEALELLDRARAACGDQPLAAARILLKKANVFDVMEDSQASLAALAEATPFVEASGDPHLLFSLHFNMADDVLHLERYEEAAGLLRQARDLAVEQANALDLTRVSWLTARLAAGQGRVEEALAGFEQVRRDFLGHELPYEAALASLDLAVLWLQAGRTAEVRELAVEMEAVFKAKKIHREALAALTLFCEAAKRETATVELARQVVDYLFRAQHDPALRFEG